MSDNDPNREELIELQRQNAAIAFSKATADDRDVDDDYRLARDIAKMVGEIVFEDGERMVSVWNIDGSYIVVAAWGPGEQEPSHQTLVLDDWR